MSADHPPVPDHLPTLIVTPHGKPQQILYTYLHTNYNRENYLLTPSPQGDLCVAKLFPPPAQPLRPSGGKSVSENGHGGAPGSSLRTVKCEASRNFKWSITNSGVLTPTYKCTLPSEDSPGGMADEQPLFQISKTNPSSPFWTLWYYAYAGHLIPPKRIQFGHISKSIAPDGKPITGGGTRVTITGKTDEEKAVWKTLGEGNEDMVEWAVICAALHALDDEIVKAAEAAGIRIGVMPGTHQKGAHHSSTPPPMPHNMQRPQLHPTGQQAQSSLGPNGNVPRPQQQPQQQQQQQQQPRPPQGQMQPPPNGMDPRMRDPRMGPPSPMQSQFPQQQQQHPQQQQQQMPPPGSDRQRLLSKNGPRPQQAFSPTPQHQQLPPQQQQQGPFSPGLMSPHGMMSPNGNVRPPPHAQQSNGHHHIPPQYQNGQPGPSSQQNGQSRASPPANLSALRSRSPLPAPGSAPDPRMVPMNSPPMQQQYRPQQGPPAGYPQQQRPPNGRPPSDPAQYSRTHPAPFAQVAPPPQSPRRERFQPPPQPGQGQYPPNQQQYQQQYPQQQQQQQMRSPQKPPPSSMRSPPPQQQQRYEEEDTVDSVAFMLGTTALNDAASYGDDDEAIGQRGREAVSGGYQAGKDKSRVNRLLKQR